mmetsp:Transcript_12898/g.23369  ORF Transcript_12898/g.23369 Transcript_12898/m.23369 type:complete len:297 (-) Transcript_12898:119-1009(-)
MANRPFANNSDGTRCAVPLGSLFGVRILIDWSYLITVLFAQLFALMTRDPMYSLLIFILYGPVLLLALFLHEMGHVAVTKCLGGHVTLIRIWALGGLTYYGVDRKGAGADLLIAIAGPVMNIIQIGIWAGVYFILEDGDFTNIDLPMYLGDITDATPAEFASILAKRAVQMNMMVLIANTCLPIAHFDGGRIIADILIVCGVSLRRAAFILSGLALLVGSGLVTWGLLLLGDYLIGSQATGFIYVIFGFLCVYSGFKLWGIVVDDRLLEDNLFGRPCYSEDTRQESNDNVNIASIT